MKQDNLVLSIQKKLEGMEKPPFSLLADVIRDFFECEGKDSHLREYSAIKFRYGLDSSPQLTLDEIGVILDVSKQRIAQLEQRALKELSVLFRDGEHKKRCITVTTPLKEVLLRFQTCLDAMDFPLKDDDVLRLVGEHFSSADADPASLRVILEAHGCRIAHLLQGTKHESVVWISGKKRDRRILEAAVCVFEAMRTLVLPAPFHVVKLEVNRDRDSNERFSDSELERGLQLCPDTEKIGDTSFQLAFECLQNVRDKAFRILHEEGEPLRSRELARLITKRAFEIGDTKVVKATLVGNSLSSDKRFKPIGRSEWALSDWDVDTRTVIALMEAALHTAGEPLSSGEIWYFVKANRAVSRNSIGWYLGGDHFVKLPSGQYALQEWVPRKGSESTDVSLGTRAIRERLAETARHIFTESGVDEMPLADLAREILKRTPGSSSIEALSQRLERLPVPASRNASSFRTRLEEFCANGTDSRCV